MGARIVFFLTLTVAWRAVPFCPVLLSQEELVPPSEVDTVPPPLIETGPVPTSPQEVVAKVGQMLAAVEDSEREERRKLREWYAVEETLGTLVTAIRTEGRLASGSEVEFAKAVLDAFLPEKEADQVALSARNDVLALLRDQGEGDGEDVDARTKYGWLALSVKLRRVFAAERSARSAKVSYDVGRTSLDSVTETERRLLNAKTDFARWAFDRFPIDNSQPAAWQTLERVRRMVALKHIQEAWAGALRTWMQNYEMYRHGVASFNQESLAREMVYYYESKWYERQARE